jgi:hypothetical protein
MSPRPMSKSIVRAAEPKAGTRARSDSDEGACIVLGECPHVTRVDACDLTDMRRDRLGFTARVMRVVLDKAVGPAMPARPPPSAH